MKSKKPVLAISMTFPRSVANFLSISVTLRRAQSLSCSHFQSLEVTFNHFDSVETQAFTDNWKVGKTMLNMIRFGLKIQDIHKLRAMSSGHARTSKNRLADPPDAQ